MHGKLKLLVDTNVIIDSLWQREPAAAEATLLLALGKLGEFSLWITPWQVTNLVYILSDGGKQRYMEQVLASLGEIRRFVNICPVDGVDVDRMLETTWKDPEDALLFDVALRCGMDAIITQNIRDFAVPEGDFIKVLTAPQFFAWLEEERGIAYAQVGMGE